MTLHRSDLRAPRFRIKTLTKVSLEPLTGARRSESSEPRRRTNGGMRPRLCNGGRIRAAILTPMRPPLRDRKFADSSLEGSGFETSVPGDRQVLRRNPNSFREID